LPGVAIRRLGQGDAELFNLLSETDNLFDEDPSVAPSGALTLDGARAFLADPAVLFWRASCRWGFCIALCSAGGLPVRGPNSC
jgi:hypothetical protein